MLDLRDIASAKGILPTEEYRIHDEDIPVLLAEDQNNEEVKGNLKSDSEIKGNMLD